MNLSVFRSSLFKHTAIYTITDGFSKGVAFLALPLISHYLIPRELGIAANFDVLQTIISLLTGQAVVNSMPYFYYRKSREEQAQIVSSLLLIVVVANILMSGIIFLSTNVLAQYLHIGLCLQILTIVSVIAHQITGLDLILFRLEDKPLSFSWLQITQTLLYFSLLVVFVVDFKLNALGKIYSGIIAFSAMAIVHLFLLVKRQYITFDISKKRIEELLRFGIPLLPHSLSFWFKSGFDKIIITAYCGLATNGIYSMAMSFGALYTIFNSAFGNSYIPYLQKRISQFTEENINVEKVKIVRLSYRVMSGFAVLSIIVIAACWLAVKFVLDSQYADSFQFIPWIIVGLTLNSMYGLVIQFPYSVKKTFGLGIITFSGSLIQLLLTFFLVSNIGEDGIKISYVAGSFIIMVGVWIYSNKVYPMPWFSFR